MKPFTIDDEYTLNALARALVEVKFNPCLQDRDLAGSRLIADLAVRIAEHNGGGRPLADPSSRHWMMAVLAARTTGAWWDDWDDAQRRDFARILMSPFVLPEDLAQRFLEEVAPEHWRVK